MVAATGGGRQLIMMSLCLVLLSASRGYSMPDKSGPAAECSCDKHLPTVVVGAGISGVAAANRLREKGCPVLVLEGRNTVGGRIRSVRVGHLKHGEQGAEWIHGHKYNPMIPLAKKLGISVERVGGDPVYIGGRKHIVMYDKASGQFLNKAQKGLAFKLFDVVLDQLEKLYKQRLRDKLGDITVAEGLEIIHSRHPEMTDGQRRLLEWSYEIYFGGNDGISPEDVSLNVWFGDDYEEESSGDSVVPGGYAQIPQALASGLDVRLGHRVTSIDDSASTPQRDAPIVVSGEGFSFNASRVIVTVPLGVLKRNTIQFTPPLPPRKTNAIEALGMGVLNKVILSFPNEFWNFTYSLGYVSDERGEWPMFVGLGREGKCDSNGTALEVLVGGDKALDYEKMTDGELVEGVMSVLRRMYGDAVPTPDGHVVSRWMQDEWSYGAYSYLEIGSDESMMTDLGSPEGEGPTGPRLFFAGEATNEEHYASVHGAYMSGIREADRVCKSMAHPIVYTTKRLFNAHVAATTQVV